ncbi:TPA: hypothetical protein HA242_01535 [Candidatus Woesearchaeota archaeon]|nr:hypothetical protein [Candidatus Woesearchaeota archaeon]
MIDKSDDYHEAATKIYANLERRSAWLITSDYVIDETVTWLRYKVGHNAAVEFWNRLHNSKITEIIRVDAEIVTGAWKTFLKYSDRFLKRLQACSLSKMGEGSCDNRGIKVK